MRKIAATLSKIKKLIVYGHRCSSKRYIRHLRSKGIRIGDGTVFYNPQTAIVDESDPYMIHIGRNVKITGGW